MILPLGILRSMRFRWRNSRRFAGVPVLLIVGLVVFCVFQTRPAVSLDMERVTPYPPTCTRSALFGVTNHSSRAIVFRLAVESKRGEHWLPHPVGGGTTLVLATGSVTVAPGSSGTVDVLLPHAPLWRAVAKYWEEPASLSHTAALWMRQRLGQHGLWAAARFIPIGRRIVREFADTVHRRGCPTIESSEQPPASQ